VGKCFFPGQLAFREVTRRKAFASLGEESPVFGAELWRWNG